jgi:hypothetical protein
MFGLSFFHTFIVSYSLFALIFFISFFYVCTYSEDIWYKKVFIFPIVALFMGITWPIWGTVAFVDSMCRY